MNLINKNRQTSINVMFTSLSSACPVTVKECTTYHSMLGERGRGPSTHHQDGNWESLHLPAHYTGLTLTEPTQQKGLRVSQAPHNQNKIPICWTFRTKVSQHDGLGMGRLTVPGVVQSLGSFSGSQISPATSGFSSPLFLHTPPMKQVPG